MTMKNCIGHYKISDMFGGKPVIVVNPEIEYSKLNQREMICLLGKNLIPIKGYSFSNSKTAFNLIREYIGELKSIIDIYYDKLGINLISEDIDEARQSLLHLVEMTDVKDISEIHPTVYHHLQNGLILSEEFTRKDYRKIFKTIETSLYFITTSAITFSYEIVLYDDVTSKTHYRTPLDWTLALWNALCYHKDSFVKGFIRNRREFEVFLDLTGYTCEVLSFMLKELSKHGF